ncbi:coiled-coil domain-containing protein 83 [Corvus cornix cornix]|uniref:coiled-coil domain-containing protein 83 n=1 Tax=Corvus brachyrhynchos TaxID=85066 RepID=UPI0004DE0D72|nr:PREDICTED: coiled-coil domain-containing protein 83 [Corvus brachyrhynchos]XP_010399347.1 coiled-coil domain-containing protein 83 [Corvus cornix cornix]XP_039418320.1 coiled-coil domain-containing protein 83 [Corvus cornix cornix]
MEENKKKKKPEEQVQEPESDLPEALLEYHIVAKDAAIERVLFHLEGLEETIKENLKRNVVLKEEQKVLIRRLVRQIEEKENKRDDKEVVTRDDVEESLKAVFQFVKDKEQLLQDLRSQIEETKKIISEKQRERDYWLEYKNVGSKIHAEKISSLEKDIAEVKYELERTEEYYREALKVVREENQKLFDRHMKLLSEEALKNAVGYLDKHCRREIEENEWLKEEVKIYRKAHSDLEASVQLLEEENTSLVAKLIDTKLQHLRVQGHLFHTKGAGLQEELPKDEMKRENRVYAAKADGKSLRSAFPKILPKTDYEKPQDSDEELWKKFFSPALDSSLCEDEDFQAYSKLGPLKRRLYVVGEAAPTCKEPEEMPSRSHKEEDTVGKSDGHITAEMIKALFKENVDEN